MNGEDAVSKIQRGHLAKRMQEELEDTLAKEEERIILAVMTRLNKAETLDPQFATQQWLALHSIHTLRRILKQRERQVASAGKRMANALTNDE